MGFGSWAFFSSAVLVLLALTGTLAYGFLGFIQIDRHGHEPAVAVQHLAHAIELEEFLSSSLTCSVMVVPRVVRVPSVMSKSMPSSLTQRTGVAPSRIAQGVDVHLVGDHEHGVEAQTEVADDAGFPDPRSCVFFRNSRAGEGHLLDVWF